MHALYGGYFKHAKVSDQRAEDWFAHDRHHDLTNIFTFVWRLAPGEVLRDSSYHTNVEILLLCSGIIHIDKLLPHFGSS
jgi:hypothetical protein